MLDQHKSAAYEWVKGGFFGIASSPAKRCSSTYVDNYRELRNKNFGWTFCFNPKNKKFEWPCANGTLSKLNPFLGILVTPVWLAFNAVVLLFHALLLPVMRAYHPIRSGDDKLSNCMLNKAVVGLLTLADALHALLVPMILLIACLGACCCRVVSQFDRKQEGEVSSSELEKQTDYVSLRGLPPVEKTGLDDTPGERKATSTCTIS